MLSFVVQGQEVKEFHGSNLSTVRYGTTVFRPSSRLQRHAVTPETLRPEAPLRNDKVQASKREYTSGDIYCGAGGASRGAFMAGLIPRFAIDKDLFACESYVSNFPKAQLLRKTISDWLNVEKEALPHVDVLHVSPPCQDFPPANTRKGALRGLVSPEPLPGPFPEDPSCRWAGYESAGETSNVGQILTTLSAAHKAPLAVVLKQTAGLVTHFPDWFQFLITEFANAGCSTISSVLHFQDYGLAQFSKRLVIVATALVYVFSFIF